MQRKPNNNPAYIVSIILITLFFGCTVEQSHKTLTFFFDGVDKVIFFNDYLSHDSLGKIAALKRDALLKKNRPDQCVHKPYKEKRCDQCHTPDKRLIMPMPGLCFKCHTNFNETYKVVHGPVASGGCLNCHNQHSSRYPKLLTRQGQQICLYCHNSSLVFAAKVHRDIEDAECTLCHNPHGGKTRYMVKDNVSGDANRIALMDDLTYRHLYGQVFCKVPGDINRIMEIYIQDDKGITVATVHPDANGKFRVANIHPDQNYTFRFKKDFPDCRINIMDNNGKLLYVVEKNKKQVYLFDKTAYETVHTLINDAHFLGDTIVTNGGVVSRAANNSDILLRGTAAPMPVEDVGKVPVTSGIPVAMPAGAEVETVWNSSKIAVATLPVGTVASNIPEPGKAVSSDTVRQRNVDNVAPLVTNKSKIAVATIPDTAKGPAMDRFRPMVNAKDVVRNMEASGLKLTDLTLKVSGYVDGTVVCVLNTSGDLVDIAAVNAKGEFWLFDFLYFRISLPAKAGGIIAQTIYINEQMEVIETINKHLVNGRYVYVPNSKEPAAHRSGVKIFSNSENAVLFSSVYFNEGKPTITADGLKELGKVFDYLGDHPSSNVYLLAHAMSGGSSGYNRQLSEMRAAAATDFLTGKGIKPGRIKVKSGGKNKAVGDKAKTPGADEEDGRYRRVDVYIKID